MLVQKLTLCRQSSMHMHTCMCLHIQCHINRRGGQKKESGKHASKTPSFYYWQCTFCKGKQDWNDQNLMINLYNECIMSYWKGFGLIFTFTINVRISSLHQFPRQSWTKNNNNNTHTQTTTNTKQNDNKKQMTMSKYFLLTYLL